MLSLYRPGPDELDFRRKLLGDPDTMTYNHAYGGVIGFPRERWADWYARWVDCAGGSRFYRYLRQDGGEFVGEAAYHWAGDKQIFLCDVIILARYRGKGYGGRGLELLCAAARENGVEALHDDIAADNPAVEMFLSHGFHTVNRTEQAILVRKNLLP